MSYICLPNKNSINIGTRGGATKPSSGYTFNFIQYQINKIVNQIKSKKRSRMKYIINLTYIWTKYLLMF